MSLQQVLTNLSNARGGIVSALSGRGLTVSSSTTLTGAAAVISTLPMSGSVDVSDTTAQAGNVESGYYFYDSSGTKVSGTLNVTSSGGTDVSDTTATAGDVLSGAYFYTSAGTKTQGTIPSLASQTITPGTSAQVISGGQYLSGDQTIAGDEDLVASNIKSGVTIFGVSGSLVASGGGVDVSDTTATAGSVLSGAYFYDSTGTKTQGTIPTVSASQSANVVTIPAGYHANSQTVTVGSAVQSQTITPGTSAQVLSSGGYLVGDVTIAGDAALVSANIASGVTIFGVTGSHVGGTDVSDTTATAGSVLSGSYFYDSSGTKTQGTIPSLASQTITPGTSAQVISAGQYLSGAQTIAGDAALIASNIVSGATIFGVAGSAMTSGGVDVSDTTAQAANVQSGYYFYTSGGVRTAGTLVPTEFYKCASVDSTNHTWTGYKAVLNQSGYYEFESTVTTGLTYNPDKVTPVVNMCYTDGALLLVEPYSPDIIPVDANTMFLLQGSLHDKSGHVTDASIINNGIVISGGKLTFPNNGYATIAAGSLPDTVLCDGHDWTVEASVIITQLNQSDHLTVFGRGSNPRGDISIKQGGEVYYNMGDGNHIEKSNTGIIGEHTIKLTHTSSNAFMIYVDGVAGSITNGNGSVSRNYRGYDLGIGTDYYGRYFTPNAINWLRISDCIR